MFCTSNTGSLWTYLESILGPPLHVSQNLIKRTPKTHSQPTAIQIFSKKNPLSVMKEIKLTEVMDEGCLYSTKNEFWYGTPLSRTFSFAKCKVFWWIGPCFQDASSRIKNKSYLICFLSTWYRYNMALGTCMATYLRPASICITAESA